MLNISKICSANDHIAPESCLTLGVVYSFTEMAFQNAWQNIILTLEESTSLLECFSRTPIRMCSPALTNLAKSFLVRLKKVKKNV
jgi:hypothetical protein